jgi:hypothetical protein
MQPTGEMIMPMRRIIMVEEEDVDEGDLGMERTADGQ